MSVHLSICSLEEFKNAKVYTMDEVCHIMAGVQCQVVKHASTVFGVSGFNADEEMPRVKEEMLLTMYKEHIAKEVQKAAEIRPVVVTADGEEASCI